MVWNYPYNFKSQKNISCFLKKNQMLVRRFLYPSRIMFYVSFVKEKSLKSNKTPIKHTFSVVSGSWNNKRNVWWEEICISQLNILGNQTTYNRVKLLKYKMKLCTTFDVLSSYIHKINVSGYFIVDNILSYFCFCGKSFMKPQKGHRKKIIKPCINFHWSF